MSLERPPRLWGIGQDRDGMLQVLKDSNERALLIAGKSRDFRVVPLPRGDFPWALYEFPPFFGD